MADSKLNKEIVVKILGYLSSGVLFTKIFKSADININISTYYEWMRKSDWLKEEHDRALKTGVEMRVEAIEERIEECKNDLEFRKSVEIGKNRRWHAKALNRDKYGDNQKVELGGEDGSPINIIINEIIK